MSIKLTASEQLICAIIEAHSGACAQFTERLLLLTNSALGEPPAIESRTRTGKAALEDAPAWVRKAYAKSVASPEPGEDIEKVRQRVARNSLVVRMRECGLTQKQLAERAGMLPNSVSRILRNPEQSRVATIRKLANALDTDISDIL